MIPASLTLVALIVIAPGAVFALGFLKPALGGGIAVVTLGILQVLFRRTNWRERPDANLVALSFAIAVAFTLLSGIGHVFWQADDWTVREAILFDLVRNPWPVSYRLGDADGLLRAPLGMYVTPAVVGKLGGLGAAQIALFAQNTILLALCLYQFARALPRGLAQYVGLALFFVFSGLDILAWITQTSATLPPTYLPHLEHWSGVFQYSSAMTQLFWAPHHGLAGWAIVAAYLVWRQGEASALTIAGIWVFMIAWSPLAAAGALPFLAYAFVCDARDRKLDFADVALVVIATISVLPTLYFLTRDTGSVRKGFSDVTDIAFVRGYVGLLLIEVVPYFTFAWHGRAALDRRGGVELALIGATLCLIPFYQLGFANDFAMRVSIFALTLLCFRAVPMLAALGREPVARRVAVLGIVGVGAITPAVEVFRNATTPAVAASSCNVVESLQDGPFAGSPIDYYVASQSSFQSAMWLFRAPTDTPLTRVIERCWPGRQFVVGRPSPI